jgi:hypothetical protein
MTFKATANEKKIISNFAEGANAFSFWDGGISTDNSGTWGEVINDEISSLCEVTTKSARGILGSLVKKGFFSAHRVEDAYPLEGGGHRPGNWIELTELGVEVILARKSELEELEAEYGEDVEDSDELKEALAEIADEPVDDIGLEDLEETDEELPAPVPASTVTHKAPTAHSGCDHATEGAEGKKARARCRAARAKVLKANA